MEVKLPSGLVELKGELTIPDFSVGIVIFVHGSGSSRHSIRNRSVASYLNSRGIATLLFDLLTIDEENNRSNVFDIDLLSQRLNDVTYWVTSNKLINQIPVGYFGASTGAAAALVTSALLGSEISAVVSRGGRVDLAEAILPKVKSPTLLIVGQADQIVLNLNIQAQKQLRCENSIEVIQGASHLFEEPGALEQVAILAGDWFLKFFKKQNQ